ncbi:MAG: hypothetical protein ACJ761_07455 [Chloroflexota bacterium]
MSSTSAQAESAAARGGPSVRTAARLRVLAAVLAGVAVAEALGVILISAINDARFQAGLDLPTIGFLTSVVLFPTVGALILQSRPFLRVAWLMIVIGLGLGFGLVEFGYGAIGLGPRALPFALQAAVTSQLFFVPSLGAGTAILMLLFPTDRLLSPRWRIAAGIAFASIVLFELGTLFHSGDLDTTTFPGVANPLAAPAALAPLIDPMVELGNALVTVAIVLGAVSLVVRYRSADPIEAAQIRWLALVGGLAAVAFAVAAVQIGRISDLAFGVALVLLGTIPIAIGIAITRYHLYDIDRLINRALLYGSLTAILAGVFTAAIGLAQRVFVSVRVRRPTPRSSSRRSSWRPSTRRSGSASRHWSTGGSSTTSASSGRTATKSGGS